MNGGTIGLCIHIMSLKNSSILGATPKKSIATFQFQSFEMNQANFSQNNVVGLGFLASDRAPKDSIPSKLLPDDPFEVPSYNACLSKYASQEWKAYWGIESDTKE